MCWLGWFATGTRLLLTQDCCRLLSSCCCCTWRRLPHRAVHFFADSTKAKFDLGWQPAHSLQKDAKALVDEYVKSGRAGKSIDFGVDDRILNQQRAYA